jgi:hypothetical protein
MGEDDTAATLRRIMFCSLLGVILGLRLGRGVTCSRFRPRTLFDATEYFQQADPGEIVALAQEQWGGDYEADAVAQYYDGQHPEVTAMFHKKNCGFECYVNSQQALDWLKTNRPEVYEVLERQGNHEPIRLIVPIIVVCGWVSSTSAAAWGTGSTVRICVL